MARNRDIAADRNQRPFGDVVEDALREIWGQRRPNYARLHRMIKGISYEGLRQMIAGDLAPRADVMEQVAEVIGRDPSDFKEYRLYEISECFSRHPELEVHLYDTVKTMCRQLDDAKH